MTAVTAVLLQKGRQQTRKTERSWSTHKDKISQQEQKSGALQYREECTDLFSECTVDGLMQESQPAPYSRMAASKWWPEKR